jgi:hypothetical protein
LKNLIIEWAKNINFGINQRKIIKKYERRQ